MTLYPIHYQDDMVSLAELRRVHEPRMHPEFARRLFAWIEHKGGTIGIGGGFRETQPDRPGFAPDGKSFHQLQRWASGREAYAAVDLVKVNPIGDRHVAPDWADSDDAHLFDLHTFIRNPIPEPWHMQPIEIRGWTSWVMAGRPDPIPYSPPPPEPEPEPEPEPNPEGYEMLLNYVKHPRHDAVYAQWSNGTKSWIPDPDTFAVFAFLDNRPVEAMPDDAWMRATGPIVGPRPFNVDGWGIPR